MSLDYDLRNIKDWRKVCKTETGEVKKTTEWLIFMTMRVDLGRVHADGKEGIDEWIFRLAVLQEVGEFELDDSDVDILRAHIGLCTNVSYVPRQKWLKDRVLSHIQRNASRKVRYYSEREFRENGKEVPA